MKLINDAKKPKYKTMLFCDLEYGDIFEDSEGNVCIKTRNFTTSGFNNNAIRLNDMQPLHYQDIDDVFLLNATLHYERILEGE